MPVAGEALGPYVVLRRLGVGGMGEVWLARDPRLEREVALKTLPRAIALDADQLARFRREALALAAVNHPNIATIHGLETLADGTLLLVLERVDGVTLAARLADGALGPEESRRIGVQIAEALEVAHERGVVHRDLKPGNVMIGPRGLVKVLDFGLARAADTTPATHAPMDATPGTTPEPSPRALANPEAPVSEENLTLPVSGGSPQPGSSSSSLGPLTMAGEITGTPGYMSPEQARAQPQDARTDVFAFGCVLYECLSGRRAFRAESIWETLALTIAAEVDMGALPGETPPTLREVVAGCLARDVADRIASMREVRERLTLLPDSARVPTRPATTATPNNLPRSLTSFVGRAAELEAAETALERTRLLTFTGVGGCGKTRLALELAGRRLAERTGGVWFADLARISDPERVPEVMAAAMGLREEPGRSIEASLESHLASRRALLLLDNCEHVLGACSELALRLLQASRELLIVATSREGLGVPGETLQAVPSLGLPPRSTRGATDIERHEAVQLFLERARAAEPEFTLAAEDQPALAEICRRLDGIPLALELAAARVRVLSIAQIRDRLDDRFRLLTGGSRTALPRHQTLRAALQWSWDQLHEPEQVLLRTLAVFAGGWTFEAVAAVTPQEDDEFEVLDLLAQLVAKSLVVVERDERGVMRYRFLESVRQLALERLDESGEGAMLRARHLGHFLALAEASEKHLTGAAQAEWFNRLEAEQENLLAALAFTEHVPGGATHALRLAGSVWRFWSARGHHELGRRALEHALSRPGADAPTPIRARALVRAGALALYQGDWDAAWPLIEQSLALYRELHDEKGVARALSGLAIVATYREDDETAERTNLESLELYGKLGQARGVAIAHHNLGYLAWCRADHVAARGHYEQAREILARIGDREMLALTLAGLAEALLRLGDSAAAGEQYAQSLTIARELEARREAAYALEGVADMAVGAGDCAGAARLFGAAESLRREIGTPQVPREQRERDHAMARIVASLGAEATGREVDSGRGKSFGQALEEALEWLRRQTTPKGRESEKSS